MQSIFNVAPLASFLPLIVMLMPPLLPLHILPFLRMHRFLLYRAAAPLTRLLERNNIKPADLAGVQLLGGGSRIPALQAALTEALGGRTLDRRMDADEAVVQGAALFGANLSTSFRVRKFGMVDKAVYGVQFVPGEELAAFAGSSSSGQGEEGEGEAGAGAAAAARPKVLLPAGKKLPVKRALRWTNLTADPFTFTLAYNESSPHGLPPGVKDTLIGR